MRVINCVNYSIGFYDELVERVTPIKIRARFQIRWEKESIYYILMFSDSRTYLTALEQYLDLSLFNVGH